MYFDHQRIAQFYRQAGFKLIRAMGHGYRTSDFFAAISCSGSVCVLVSVPAVWSQDLLCQWTCNFFAEALREQALLDSRTLAKKKSIRWVITQLLGASRSRGEKIKISRNINMWTPSSSFSLPSFRIRSSRGSFAYVSLHRHRSGTCSGPGH